MPLVGKESNCPICDKNCDAATGLDHNESPNPGDISICFYCGSINQFDNDLGLTILPTTILNKIRFEEPETYQMIMNVVIKIKANNK